MSYQHTKITIAIDGFSACGKSTLARDLADKLGYLHVDSGAMYRAATLYFIEHQIDIGDSGAIEKALDHIAISFDRSAGTCQTVLNDRIVEDEIRSMEVNKLVSPVAALSSVRRALVAQQRQLGARSGVIMDGRDIGTVVFPKAQLKLFLTADLDIRIDRRMTELIDKGITIDREQVRRSLQDRDLIDSTREDSPLRQAEDSIVMDNSHLTRQKQLEIAYNLALQRIQLTTRQT